jgi:predicted Zn-dependent peptidase
MESTLGRMNRMGSAVLTGVPLLTLDEQLAAIDAVTLDEVHVLATELFDPARMSAAGVGGSGDIFRRALGKVSAELAAA